MRALLASRATGPVPGAHDSSPTSPPTGDSPRMQWPAVPMYRWPSLPENAALNVHWPTSLFTIAPGRTPGHGLVPTGAASGTWIRRVWTPPSVQFHQRLRIAPAEG